MPPKTSALPDTTPAPRAVRRTIAITAWGLAANLLAPAAMIYFLVQGQNFRQYGQLVLVGETAVVVLSVAGILGLYFQHRRLKRALSEHDGRLCTECEYVLPPSPSQTGRCPECGSEYDLERGREKWRRSGWRAARTPDDAG